MIPFILLDTNVIPDSGLNVYSPEEFLETLK